MRSKKCVSTPIKELQDDNRNITMHFPEGVYYLKIDDDKMIHLFFNQADRDEYIKENNLKLRKHIK